jgi:hypothetical protein
MAASTGPKISSLPGPGIHPGGDAVLHLGQVIGAVSVAMSRAGLELGRHLGRRAGDRGEILGGLVLIGVGVAVGAGLL